MGLTEVNKQTEGSLLNQNKNGFIQGLICLFRTQLRKHIPTQIWKGAGKSSLAGQSHADVQPYFLLHAQIFSRTHPIPVLPFLCGIYRVTKIIRGLEPLPYENRQEKGDLRAAFQCLKRAYEKSGEGSFYKGTR